MPDPPAEVLTRPAQLASIVDPWRELASRGKGSYFVSPDWVLSWWKTVGQAREAQVGVWRDLDGRVDAVVPMIQAEHRLHRRFPFSVPVWSNLGSGVGLSLIHI